MAALAALEIDNCMVEIDAEELPRLPGKVGRMLAAYRLESPQTPQGAAALGGTTRAPIVVVSLHPFGLPVDAALPPGVADVTLAVRQQPDAYLFDPPTGATPAWRESGATASQQEVLIRARELAGAWGLGTTGTLLADERLAEADGWLAALAVPLATGASVVLASNVADLESVVAQERVTARAVSAARP